MKKYIKTFIFIAIFSFLSMIFLRNVAFAATYCQNQYAEYEYLSSNAQKNLSCTDKCIPKTGFEARICYCDPIETVRSLEGDYNYICKVKYTGELGASCYSNDLCNDPLVCVAYKCAYQTTTTNAGGGGPGTTSAGGGGPGTTSAGGGGSPTQSPRCSDTYIHAFVIFDSSGKPTYSRDCSCTSWNGVAATKPASDVGITDDWKCTCSNSNWNWAINGGANYCCGYPQETSTSCMPQNPSRYGGATHDSCYNFGNGSRPSQCFAGGGSSWCCYKVDTKPYAGSFSRCSDKYKYCYASWTTDSSGLDTPKTNYASNCECNASNVSSENPLCPFSNCSTTTSSTIPGTPPACGTACTTPANCNTARDGCTTCINNVCAIPPTTSSTIPGTPPACGTACTTPANCNTARDGCTTCINNVCAIPPTTSSTIPGTPPACGTACTTPANCNTARDGCTTCVGGTCTQPFNPASCTCDNITYSALFSGQDVTITSFSKITGADVSNAKVVSEKFHMAKGNTTSGKIIAESDDIPSKIIQSSSSTVRYETQWQFKLPQLETGATYRIWSDINCQPITSAKSYNVLQKMAVLGAETKTSFIDTILGFFNNIVQNVSNILKSEDDSKKTIQLETLKPAVVIEKGCSTIIFRQD